MIQLVFLGTCAGIEPVREYRHSSFAVSHGGRTFFFDAGEGCSRTACLLGADLLRTRAVFISHCHMDHVAGLGGLLMNMYTLDKVSGVCPPPMEGKTVTVFIPGAESWEGIMRTLRGTGTRFDSRFAIEQAFPEDGKIFSEDGFSVHAAHNLHLDKDVRGRWLSFSYAIEADGRKIVYSGDVRSVSELAPLLDNCDLLLMETGHHRVEDVCSWLRDAAPGVKELGLLHHGREMISSPREQLEKARELFGGGVRMLKDGTSLEIQAPFPREKDSSARDIVRDRSSFHEERP